MEKIIFIAGPPGSGKNTQAKFISKEFDAAFFDTGDMVRRFIKSGRFPSGEKLEKGELMPIKEVLVAAKEELGQLLNNGEVRRIVVSGIPRSEEQAFGFEGEEGVVDWLEREYGKEKLVFIHVNITEEETIKRNLKRNEGRVDDKPDILQTRIREYKEETLPVFDVLREKGFNVIEIDGMPSREQVFADIKKHLS